MIIQGPVADNSLSGPSIYHNEQSLKVKIVTSSIICKSESSSKNNLHKY